MGFLDKRFNYKFSHLIFFLGNIQLIISFQKMPSSIATSNINIARKKSIY